MIIGWLAGWLAGWAAGCGAARLWLEFGEALLRNIHARRAILMGKRFTFLAERGGPHTRAELR
jgi:hypothetical protein